MHKIPVRERTAIIQSLKAGVVPAIGLPYIQVGRKEEVEALVKDLQIVEEGSSTVRFIVGRFGSGKTFFLNLIRNVALQRKFLVLQADITTDRRLYGTGGEGRALYAELMRNLATRAKPEGGALQSCVERWVGEIDHEVKSAGGNAEDTRGQITKRLRGLQDLVSGFDFATVMTKYYDGYHNHNDDLQDKALRWFRGEYGTKTEARDALGVRTIIDDSNSYDYLKLWAAFARLAGYKGLLVNIDELVVLSHRLTNTTARNKNFEAILKIINDCLQGRAEGLCFLFAGTDECIEDKRRGLYSYEALQTRLAPNRFASDDRRDYSTPVIKLQNLSPEDCYVLLSNVRAVFAGGDVAKQLIPDEGIVGYLQDCQQRMGAAYFQTPRDTVRDFVNLLGILEQNASTKWQDLLRSKEFVSLTDYSKEPNEKSAPGSDLSEFNL
ncbi:ATP-binding protein [Anatilimnocola sp. NA78]|uniref:ATP-binding protein n=1 Tax=Anatilimnocola sp. NA78 TaxID=3415683 RepID=UPI003CE51189